MSGADDRSGGEILSDLLELTRLMLQKRQDAGFLIEAVVTRQILMDEYDSFALQNPPAAAVLAQDPDIKFLVEDVISMDKSILEALEAHKTQAKADVKASNNQQRVLAYVNNAMSRRGSYMDYSK